MCLFAVAFSGTFLEQGCVYLFAMAFGGTSLEQGCVHLVQLLVAPLEQGCSEILQRPCALKSSKNPTMQETGIAGSSLCHLILLSPHLLVRDDHLQIQSCSAGREGLGF